MEPDNMALPLAAKNARKGKSVGKPEPVWESYVEADANPALTVEEILQKLRNKHKKSLAST